MRLLATLVLLSPLLSYAQSPKWDSESEVAADINCDGKIDKAKIGYLKSEVVLSVALGGSDNEQSLRFGIGSNAKQNSLCGTSVHLSSEIPPRDDEDTFIYGLGVVPEGHIFQEGCSDLRLSSGECDSIHVYWNHTKNQLSWWRL